MNSNFIFNGDPDPESYAQRQNIDEKEQEKYSIFKMKKTKTLDARFSKLINVGPMTSAGFFLNLSFLFLVSVFLLAF